VGAVRRAGVTGANGYVGSVLARSLSVAGWQVVKLVRLPAAPRDGRSAGPDEQRHYDLREEPSAHLLEGLDAVVLCAWDMSLTRREDVWNVNVEGTNALAELAGGAGVRTVLVSSMSAYEGTRQHYGIAKLACERVVLSKGGAVVRPGLVYGPGAGGMVGRLKRLARLPVVPLVGASSKLFTVHEDDLGDGLVAVLSATGAPRGPLGLAHDRAVTLENVVLACLAGTARPPWVIRLPWRLGYVALKSGEALGLPLPFRSDSILSFVDLPPSPPNQGFLASCGVKVRPFAGTIS